MKDNARNLAVGVTVLVALAVLATMIFLFAGLPQLLQGGYKIRILADGTHDLHTGDGIHLRGMQVGRLTKIEFTNNDPGQGITLVGYINGDVRLPGNTQAFIYTRGMVGGAYLELKPEGEFRKDSRGRPLEYLPTDGSLVFSGAHAAGGELIPQDLKDELMKALHGVGTLTTQFSQLLGGTAEAGASQPATGAATAAASGPAAAPSGLSGTLAKLDAALQAVNQVLGSQENQKNIQESLANLAKATAKAGDAMDSLKDFAAQAQKSVKDVTDPAALTLRRFDDVAQKFIQTADSISKTMDSLSKVAATMQSGEGTAGKLLNDPKLYNDLVDTTRQLNNLIDDLRAMVKEWRDKGIPFKMK